MSILALSAKAKAQTAAECAAMTGATIFAARFFRAAMDRVFFGARDENALIRVALFATAFAVVWFVFVFACSAFDTDPVVSIPVESSPTRGGLRSAALVVSAMAIAAWLILVASDDLLASRLLPWTLPLIWLQWPGFQVASRLFPCQKEGFDTGCEAWKKLPVFWLSNAVTYLPFVLVGRFVYYRSARMRTVWPRAFRWLIRWGTLFGSAGLGAQLLFYRLTPGASLPFHRWDMDRIGWVILEDATGITSLVLFLLIPFCGYGLIRAVWARKYVRPALVDLTWLVSYAFIALILGDPFRY